MIIEVAFLPQVAFDLEKKACVVIDVVRAGTTLVCMFQGGASKVLLAEGVEKSFELARTLPDRPLLCGEADARMPEGFDYGNSPEPYLTAPLAGRTIVYCSSNGARAMKAVSSAPVVLIGALLNAQAVMRSAFEAASQRSLDICIICSGDRFGTKFCLEDALCAGYYVRLLEGMAEEVVPMERALRRGRPVGGGANIERVPLPPRTIALDDSAVAARALFDHYLHRPRGHPTQRAMLEAFQSAYGVRFVHTIGLGPDVEFCAQVDISSVVPLLAVQDGRLVIRQG